MALLISMITVMVLLFSAMLLMRRRQMLAKKGLPPSRSNGAVLVTPLSLKHDAPLWMDKDILPEYTSTLPGYAKLTLQNKSRNCNSLGGEECDMQHEVLNTQNNATEHSGVKIHTNPLHQTEFNRPERLECNNCDKLSSNTLRKLSDLRKNYHKKLKDFSNMQVQDYANPNLGSVGLNSPQISDYAEVDANVTNERFAVTSPEPYATTTLVTGTRRTSNSLVSILFCNIIISYVYIHCLHKLYISQGIIFMLITKNKWRYLQVYDVINNKKNISLDSYTIILTVCMRRLPIGLHPEKPTFIKTFSLKNSFTIKVKNKECLYRN